VLADQSRYERDAILGRMIQAGYGSDSGQVAALGANNSITVASLNSLDDEAMGLGPRDGYVPPPAQPDLAFWTRAFGAWANLDGNGNAASAARQLGGFLSGMDAGVGGGWRIGAATGFSQSNISVDARHSSADVNTVYLAGYTGGNFGPIAFRSGGAWGWHDIDTSRFVVFPGFSEKEEASYRGDTGQVFGEAAYPMLMGSAAVEPFAGLAFVHVGTDSFHERGGVAALRGASEDEDVGYSTLGLRAATTWHLSDVVVTPHASAAWQHAFGDLTPNAALAFLSTGTGFVITGASLAQDSALIDVGFDLNLRPTVTLGASYAGQFANQLQDNAVKGRFTWIF
jgi:outer membrane autotransporter protein